MPSGEIAGAIAQRAFEEGLLVETSGPSDEVVKLLPALTIPEELLGKGLDIIEAAVDEALAA
jgi:diaminobutyrate-2-oxoglutarate transaminase